MSARRKLTDEQIIFALQVMRKREDVLRQAKMYPTREELAEKLGLSSRQLLNILKSKRSFLTPEI